MNYKNHFKITAQGLSLCVGILLSIALILFSERVYAMEATTLKNGLQIFMDERPETGVVAAQVWVRVGSGYEDDKVAGVTHFIEHLIFKGTDKLKGNAFAERIESLGGSVNAFTSYDNTVYHIVLPKASFSEGLELLLESVKNPAFPEEEIEKERNVVLEEIKMGEDDTRRKLFKELFSLSYQGHPYGRPVIGFVETVGKLNRDNITAYYKTHYIAKNMTIVISGDFDNKLAKKKIEMYLGGLASGSDGGPGATHVKEMTGRESTVERDAKEDYLALSYLIPKITDKDIPPLEILGTILADGESARLVESLKREKGLVTGISTYVFSPREEGLFVVYATSTGKDRDLIVREIINTMKEIENIPPTDFEMEKAKNIIKASHIYASETVQGRAHRIGDDQTLTGNPYFSELFLQAIDKVSAEDIKRVFNTYISGRKPTIAYLKSKKKKDNPYTLELPNGMKCIVNKNKSSKSFAFRVGFVGGVKDEPDDGNGLFNLLSRMLLKGTKNKNAPEIAREIDFLAGDISPYNGRNLFGLSGKFLSKDMKRVLFLLKELLVESVFTDEELKRVKVEVLSELRQRDDDPASYTFLRFNEVLYGDHPYRKDPAGTESDIEKINLVALTNFYKRFISPSNTVLAISGDVNESEVFGIFRALFSEWSGGGNNIVKIAAKAHAAKKEMSRDIIQTHMVFGFLGPGLSDKDRYAVEIIDAILSGMGGRIHKLLREENPYAYAVTFFNQMAYEVSGMGIYIGTNLKHATNVEKISKEEIKRIVEKGFTEEEVKSGKNYLIGNHYIKMQSNVAIASTICFDTMYGLASNHFKTYPDRISKVKREEINGVARKYLQLDKMVQISVGAVSGQK